MKKRQLWLIPLFVLSVAVSGCFDDGDDDDDDGSGDGSGGGESEHILNVKNESGYTIWYLYVSPSTDDNWGPDQLGSSVLSPGETYSISISDCDREYDFRAEDDESGSWEEFDVYLSCGSTHDWNLYD